MLNNKELQLFEEKNLAVFKEMAAITAQKKELEKTEKKLKEELLEQFEKYGIKKLNNDYITITYVKGSETKTLDVDEFKELEPDNYYYLLKDFHKKVFDVDQLKAMEPELYDELFEDYPKVSKRKSYLKFELPKGK